jgi:cytochrome c oxidase assembly protein subunit 16
MPPFSSRPLNESPLYLRLKRHPALFGVPFLLVMVGASFGLQSFTQTRYDLHSQKVTQVRALLPTKTTLFF